MPHREFELSTGLTGLDALLTGLLPGDNVVWQVASVDEYVPFTAPYCDNALARGKGLVYFRFARHAPLVEARPGVEIRRLRPEEGFEAFVSDVHRSIERQGRGGYYVFDMLSDLAVDWYSDQMLGNFFMLACPYLYEVGAIAYFGLLQGYHSQEASGPISDTAQILLDVFRHKGKLYVHPLKVHRRYSATMYMLHERDGEDFRPVTQSATMSEIMTAGALTGLEGSTRSRGVVGRAFLDAEEMLDVEGRCQFPPEESRAVHRRLLRMVVTRDERLLALLEKYLSLEDVLNVRRRMVGSGLIGGKSVGMLLARAILEREAPRWREMLEPHDSFYVGSDVYYTFVVRNGLWWVRERQKDEAGFLDGAERARQRMLVGTFPEYIVRQFAALLDYFGQSPIIVRSSSLLEDNFGNSFAGKYDSVFCANQGPRHERLENFLSAVRVVYASTMSEAALTYRSQRGLLERDEQMALLVQRVSGGMYGELFFPQMAGVGLSYNPYVWSSYIEPEAGMLRLVFGLGTRAVDRCDDDYTRVVALNAPERRPESGFDKVRRYSQRRVDVISLSANRRVPTTFQSVAKNVPDYVLDLAASRGAPDNPSGGDAPFPWVLTFERLLGETSFAADMRGMLALLQKTYEYPVDVEFTVNFLADGSRRINLVQCRPLQVKGGCGGIETPCVSPEAVVLSASGAVIGRSRVETIDRLIYVAPAVYGTLPEQQRYSVARLIGRLIHLPDAVCKKVLLVGPGRWGTSTPSLGVPVSFGEISAVSALCELVTMRDGLVPDVSLGTHFFNELVEADILYAALFPGKDGNILNETFINDRPNRLGELIPGAAEFAAAVRVIDADALPGAAAMKLSADALAQQVLCYLDAGNK
ncbi:MAG TPA: pyruvate, phosphate dikinase [Planctomycetes bacterium]|nr:pyruvate, phosphate dikinase [Planctomycetota bacterium]